MKLKKKKKKKNPRFRILGFFEKIAVGTIWIFFLKFRAETILGKTLGCQLANKIF